MRRNEADRLDSGTRPRDSFGMKDPRFRFGIDLGGSKIEIVALDSEGRELLRRRVPTPQGDYPATLRALQ